MKTYLDLYKSFRAKYAEHPEWFGHSGLAANQLKSAKYIASVSEAWDKAEAAGMVRFRVEPDDNTDLDDLLGDVFDPSANPDIPESRLTRERQREIDRIERDGVWGIVGEYAIGPCQACGRDRWAHGGSCWGFVGDDWKEDAEIDIKAETLTAAGINY